MGMVGDLYWSLALLTAWCAGDSCAGTRKINGQKRCLELERLGLDLRLAGPGLVVSPGLQAGAKSRSLG